MPCVGSMAASPKRAASPLTSRPCTHTASTQRSSAPSTVLANTSPVSSMSSQMTTGESVPGACATRTSCASNARPTAKQPTWSAMPRALAPPIVAMYTASKCEIDAPCVLRSSPCLNGCTPLVSAREATMECRHASQMEGDGPAAMSVPRPTLTPASCALRLSIDASAKKKFDSGQCAMPVPRAAYSFRSSSVRKTECAMTAGARMRPKRSKTTASVSPKRAAPYATSQSPSLACDCTMHPCFAAILPSPVSISSVQDGRKRGVTTGSTRGGVSRLACGRASAAVFRVHSRNVSTSRSPCAVSSQ
mmetsp:Transcript_14962/g.52074  ORF Transcript_14962/g.52074 Transcript_14962/m.52074 type:complete len:305 (-) Transcript_14962:745-1659(-)